MGADPVLAGQPCLEFGKAGVGVGHDRAANPTVGQSQRQIQLGLGHVDSEDEFHKRVVLQKVVIK